MEYLWTPWRMAYIAGDSAGTGQDQEASVSPDRRETASVEQVESSGCVFCDRAQLPESRDRESLIVLRGEHNFVILNLYPYNSAHLMVVPYLHTADLPGLSSAAVEEMMDLVQRMTAAISDEYRPEGFNIGMNLGRVAGAGVADHLHMHVVPRWAGDTNFMPVIGSTKVMPELLETTYDRLRRRLGS